MGALFFKSTFRGNRIWTIVAGMVVVLVILLFVGYLNLDLIDRYLHGVKRGVTLGDTELGLWYEDEVYSHVSELAIRNRVEPIPAAIDHHTGGVIPHMNGLVVDVKETVARVMQAEPGSYIEPVLKEITPKISTASFPKLPIARGNPARKAVAFTINVAWGNGELPVILEVLKRYDVKADFFLTGRWTKAFPELAKMIARDGHEFGNHSFSDRKLSSLSAGEIREEIKSAGDVIEATVGKKPLFFSTPYGEWDERAFAIARELGYTNIWWSIDTVDWKLPGIQAIARNAIDNVHNGAIILLHPTPQTGPALDIILSELTAQGYRILPLRELFDPTPLWGLVDSE